MLNNIYVFFIVSMVFSTPILLAEKGEVIFEKGDHYVIDTRTGYAVAEWYGGGIPSEGNQVIGNLSSYGFKDIYNTSTEMEIRMYIEDYMLDEDDAIELVYELED